LKGNPYSIFNYLESKDGVLEADDMGGAAMEMLMLLKSIYFT
jgi:hypothetical protein